MAHMQRQFLLYARLYCFKIRGQPSQLAVFRRDLSRPIFPLFPSLSSESVVLTILPSTLSERGILGPNGTGNGAQAKGLQANSHGISSLIANTPTQRTSGNWLQMVGPSYWCGHRNSVT